MTYLDNYKAIARLGLPILVGQVGMVCVGFADNIMVGRYSTEALASASFVNNIFNTIIFFCIGFTYGVLPLAGALFAKGEKLQTGALVRVALWMNIAYCLFFTLLMFILYFNVHRLGQPSELLPVIRPYYLLFLGGLLPISMFNCFAQWSYSIKNTVVPMWIVLGTNGLNVLGNYCLIYGNFGFPEMGLTGAGISTLITRWLCPLIIMAWFFWAKSNKEFADGFKREIAEKGTTGKVWRTSLPVSLQMAFETASFSVAAIMAGWLGAIQLASFQIIIIIGMLGFTLYYAIGSAVAVLVSNEAGKGSAQGMRKAGWAGYHAMLVMTLCSTLLFVLFARPLAHLFTEDEMVLATTLTLIFPLILYQLGDATQVTFANALRGTSHVMPMLWIAFVSYMVVGVPATYLLGFTAGLGIYGIVLSFSVSLFLAGALFLIFFLRATRPIKNE
ncbi:MAG: MATE family efflux transporter [Bacteroidales bacterium]|nr:MATE family efflux transporter [Bacteroidales bacterium]